jgi:hypothetical protein
MTSAVSRAGLAASFILTAFLCACSSTKPTHSLAISPSDSFFLDPPELDRTLAAANAGSVAAMKALAMHYSVAIGEDQVGAEWFRRAGDAGDAESRVTAICLFKRLGTDEQKARVPELAARWHLSSECH